MQINSLLRLFWIQVTNYIKICMLQNCTWSTEIINLHLPAMTVLPSPWSSLRHSIFFSWVGPSSSTDTLMLCKAWQEEITENLLIFPLKSLLDDYCICSSENEVWEHSNICHYKGFIKRDWTTLLLPICSHPPPTHTYMHTYNLATVLSLNLRNNIPRRKGLDLSPGTLLMCFSAWEELLRSRLILFPDRMLIGLFLL